MSRSIEKPITSFLITTLRRDNELLTPCNFLHGSLSVLPGHFPLTPEVALYPDTVPSYDSHNELLSRGLVPYPLFQAEAPGLNSGYIFRRPCLAYGTQARL